MRKKTVLMTIDQELVALVDLIAVTEWTNRSAITRIALQERTDRYNNDSPILNKAENILDNNKKLNDINSSNAWWPKKAKLNGSWSKWIKWSWGNMKIIKGPQVWVMSDGAELMSSWVHDSDGDNHWGDEDNKEEQVINQQTETVWDTKQSTTWVEGTTTAGWKIPLRWESEIHEYESDFPIW